MNPNETLEKRTVRARLFGLSAINILLIAIALTLGTYAGVYIWARSTGLFSWARMRPQYITPGHIRTLMPLGNRAVAILPSEDMPEEEWHRLNRNLSDRKRTSLKLWPYYRWLAKLEVACRPDMAARE